MNKLNFQMLKDGLLSITPAITTPISFSALLGGNLYKAAEENEKYLEQNRKENCCVNCGIKLQKHDEDGFCLDCYDEIR